jgi:phenylacetate-CoA ligase
MSGVVGIVWPPVTGGLAARIGAQLALLERSQWFGPAQIADMQARRLAALVTHHAAHTPAFARRLADAGLGAGDIARPDDLARLPVIERRTIQTTPDLFAATLPDGHGPTHDATTSGSTGEPLTIRRTAINDLDWMAMTMRDHRWRRRDMTAPFATLRAHVQEQRLPHWSPPASLIEETGPMLVLPIERPIAEQVAALRDFGARCLLAYPSNLTAIIAHVAQTGGELRIPDVRTMGEGVGDGLRADVAHVLGGRLTDCYSSNEFGYLALECPEGIGYHLMAETHIVELLDDDGLPVPPGEEGEVVVTDLRNFAMPLIRYAPGDRAVAAGACPCGRGLASIHRILGRRRDLLVHPDGRRNWPTVGQALFPALADVLEYQFIQHAPDRIEMRLVTASPFTEAQQAALRARVLKALEWNGTLDFSLCEDRVPRGRTGKRDEFVCLVGEERRP